MKKLLVLTTALCLCTSVAAHAHQTAQPTAPTYNASATNNVAAQSHATAGAAARAASSATGGNASAQGGQGGAGGRGGHSNASTGPITVNNTTGGGGSGYAYRNNTPDVFAPAINGGNPCTVGASGGLAVPAFGLSFGASGEGQKCSQRMTAAILFQAGMSGAAIQLLCRDPDVQLAMIDAGRPCQTTIAAWQNAGYRQRADGYWIK